MTVSRFRFDDGGLNQLVHPEAGRYPVPLAKAILKLKMAPAAKKRLSMLSKKNKVDSITATERSELEQALHLGLLMDLFRARALASLADESKRSKP